MPEPFDPMAEHREEAEDRKAREEAWELERAERAAEKAALEGETGDG